MLQRTRLTCDSLSPCYRLVSFHVNHVMVLYLHLHHLHTPRVNFCTSTPEPVHLFYRHQLRTVPTESSHRMLHLRGAPPWWRFTSVVLHLHGTPPPWCSTLVVLHLCGASPPWCSTLVVLHLGGAPPPWCFTSVVLRCFTSVVLHPGDASPPWCSTLVVLHLRGASPWCCFTLVLLHPASPWRPLFPGAGEVSGRKDLNRPGLE